MSAGDYLVGQLSKQVEHGLTVRKQTLQGSSLERRPDTVPTDREGARTSVTGWLFRSSPRDSGPHVVALHQPLTENVRETTVRRTGLQFPVDSADPKLALRRVLGR